jgi:hypothetical protein
VLSIYLDVSGDQRVTNPELRSFIDRVIIPALLDRFLKEQSANGLNDSPPIRPAA